MHCRQFATVPPHITKMRLRSALCSAGIIGGCHHDGEGTRGHPGRAAGVGRWLSDAERACCAPSLRDTSRTPRKSVERRKHGKMAIQHQSCIACATSGIHVSRPTRARLVEAARLGVPHSCGYVSAGSGALRLASMAVSSEYRRSR